MLHNRTSSSICWRDELPNRWRPTLSAAELEWRALARQLHGEVVMIDYPAARKLIAEANAIYDVMLAEGSWCILTSARRRSDSDNFSLSEVALCTVAECRNPSPIQDIPDLRWLDKHGTRASLKRYFVAVFQTMFNYQPVYDSESMCLQAAI